MKGFVTSTTQTVVDENGIERVRTESKQFVYKSDEDSFYNVFIKYVHWMYDIDSAVTLKVLIYLMEIAEFNTGKVLLTTGQRTKLCEVVGISKPALSRAIRELVVAGAIAKTYLTNGQTGEQMEIKGEYMINPEMFWKGDQSTRKQLVVEFRAVYDDDPEDSYDFDSTEL